MMTRIYAEDARVLIKGAGDMATGIGYRLFKSGFKVFMTDIQKPACIRRKVAFSEAIYDGRTKVEDITAVLARCPEEAFEISSKGYIPVLIDPEARSIEIIKPTVVVDAIMAKHNLGTDIHTAPVVIGVGPGFFAGSDCDAVIETMRGHDLGRVIYKGGASPNTGIPGTIEGYAKERVIYAPCEGIIEVSCDIGSQVKKGESIARVRGTDIAAPISGVLRGMIRNEYMVEAGMKIGDIDPRANVQYCYTISDKARAVGGGVLEAIMYLMKHNNLL